jgi:hypothetical protein
MVTAYPPVQIIYERGQLLSLEFQTSEILLSDSYRLIMLKMKDVPTNISTKSLPEQYIKGTPAVAAVALASIVSAISLICRD